MPRALRSRRTCWVAAFSDSDRPDRNELRQRHESAQADVDYGAAAVGVEDQSVDHAPVLLHLPQLDPLLVVASATEGQHDTAIKVLGSEPAS